MSCRNEMVSARQHCSTVSDPAISGADQACGQSRGTAAGSPSAKLRQGNTEVQMGGWHLSTPCQPTDTLPPALTDISSAKSASVRVCQEETFA